MNGGTSKGLVLMIHGLGGGADTWGRFPELLRNDAEVSSRFDIADPYTYTTNPAGIGPGIDALAQELATHLALPKFAHYPQIILFGHSMGGLVAKRLVADLLIAGSHLRIRQIVAFASPLLGSGVANMGRVISSAQLTDLSIGSQFIECLGANWAATKADQQVRVSYIIGGDDAVVAPWSSTAGFREANFHRIGGHSHRSLVKPESASEPVVQLSRNLLLDTAPNWWRPPAEADYRQPSLDASLLPNSPAARFIYRARTVEFFGREQEWAALHGFLAAEGMFRWQVVSGHGGVGKSRLALELCLAHHQDWYAGFVRDSALEHDWANWQPLVPTLLILDYATRNTAAVQKLLRELAHRTLPGCSNPLPQLVRVLLLIRPADQEVLARDVIGSGSEAVAVELSGAGPRLELGEINDPWPIFVGLFSVAGKPLPDKSKTLIKLEQLDQLRRPLFAYFLADALISASAGGEVNLDPGRLLKDVIGRWRDNFWLPAFRQEDLGKGRAEETLLALATLCNGIPLGDEGYPLAAMSKGQLLPVWDTYKHPQVFEAMTGKSAAEEIPALEPDIVGEYFVMQVLEKRSAKEQQMLINCSWLIDPFGTVSFIDRLSQDLGVKVLDSPVFSALLQPTTAPARRTAIARSVLIVNLCARFSTLHGFDAQRLIAEVQADAKAFDLAVLREMWAKGVFNVLTDLCTQDLEGARCLLGEMKVWAENKAEAPLREEWAKGAVNVLNSLRTQSLADAEGLLTEMKEWAENFAESVLRECWAKGAVNVLNGYLSEERLVEAQALLEEIKKGAELYPEADLREQWAKGAVNVLNALREKDVVGGQALLDKMKGWAEYFAEPALRECWAKGALNILNGRLSIQNRTGTQDLLTEMKEWAERHAEPVLREEWSKGAFNFLSSLVTHDVAAAQVLLAEIRLFAERYDEATLRKAWAQGAVNVLTHLSGQNLTGAKVLLADMKECAGHHAEVALWVLWAKGVVNVLNGLCIENLTEAKCLLAEMKGVSERRAEAALRVEWAHGAFNVLNCLSEQDAEGALVLLAEMKALAECYAEVTLRDVWAKGVSNVLVDLVATDPDSAWGLYADLLCALCGHSDVNSWEILTRAAIVFAQEQDGVLSEQDISPALGVRLPNVVLVAVKCALSVVSDGLDRMEMLLVELKANSPEEADVVLVILQRLFPHQPG